MPKSKTVTKKRQTKAESNAAYIQELRHQAAELNGSNRVALEKQMAADETRCGEIVLAGLPEMPSRKQSAKMDAADRILRQVKALKRSIESDELWPAVESAFFWGYFFSKEKVARDTSHVEGVLQGGEKARAKHCNNAAERTVKIRAACSVQLKASPKLRGKHNQMAKKLHSEFNRKRRRTGYGLRTITAAISDMFAAE